MWMFSRGNWINNNSDEEVSVLIWLLFHSGEDSALQQATADFYFLMRRDYEIKPSD